MLRSIETESENTDEQSRLAEKPNLNRQTVSEHIIEIVSDSVEGAQKAGHSFGSVLAKMGNGVWTAEIIPAEIKPLPRSRRELGKPDPHRHRGGDKYGRRS